MDALLTTSFISALLNGCAPVTSVGGNQMVLCGEQAAFFTNQPTRFLGVPFDYVIPELSVYVKPFALRISKGHARKLVLICRSSNILNIVTFSRLAAQL